MCTLTNCLRLTGCCHENLLHVHWTPKVVYHYTSASHHQPAYCTRNESVVSWYNICIEWQICDQNPVQQTGMRWRLHEILGFCSQFSSENVICKISNYLTFLKYLFLIRIRKCQLAQNQTFKSYPDTVISTSCINQIIIVLVKLSLFNDTYSHWSNGVYKIS